MWIHKCRKNVKVEKLDNYPKAFKGSAYVCTLNHDPKIDQQGKHDNVVIKLLYRKLLQPKCPRPFSED